MQKVRDKQHNVKTIVTERELGIWLFKQLDAGDPRIPVKPEMVGIKRHLLHCIKTDDVITSAPAYYGEIFAFIRWDAVSGGTDNGNHMCGKELLVLMGEMSDSMKQYEVSNLQLSRAVEMMIDVFTPGARHLRYGHRGKRWWLESTSAFEQRYGVKVRVDLPRKPSPDVWNLSPERDSRSPCRGEGAYFVV